MQDVNDEDGFCMALVFGVLFVRNEVRHCLRILERLFRTVYVKRARDIMFQSLILEITGSLHKEAF